MSDASYSPPTVWTWDAESGGKFASINRPIAGPTHDKSCPLASTRSSCIPWRRQTASR
jgi:GST-like protein